MEDAHICEPDIGNGVSIFGVFDGHGGREVALYVKNHFVEILKKTPAFGCGKYGDALKETCIQIDEQLKTTEGRKELADISKKMHKFISFFAGPDGAEIAANMGCTACVALFNEAQIFVANVGDSRCVISKNGKAISMSVDHKTLLFSERDRIVKAGGFIEDGRVKGLINLTRSLGDLEFKSKKSLKFDQQMLICVPDIKIEPLTPDTEFVMVACDGIWECLKNADAASFIRERIIDPASGFPKKSKIGNAIGELFNSILSETADKEGMICAKLFNRMR